MKKIALLFVFVLMVSSCSFSQWGRLPVDTLDIYSSTFGSGVQMRIDTTTTLLNLWWYDDPYVTQASIGVGTLVLRGAPTKYATTLSTIPTPLAARTIALPDTSCYLLGSGGATLTGYLKSTGNKIVTAAAMYDTLSKAFSWFGQGATVDSVMVYKCPQAMKLIRVSVFILDDSTTCWMQARKVSGTTHSSLFTSPLGGRTASATNGAWFVAAASGGDLTYSGTQFAAGDYLKFLMTTKTGTTQEMMFQADFEVIK
jgi:hypothetical protein